MLLSPHCEFSNTVEWLSIPGLYKKNGYGFEFYLLEEEDMPFCIYKDGSNDGVAAKFLYYPKEDITLTVLSNQDSNIWSMIKKSRWRYIKDIISRRNRYSRYKSLHRRSCLTGTAAVSYTNNQAPDFKQIEVQFF